MFAAVLVAIFLNGSIQAAANPEFFPSEDACKVALQKIDALVKADGMSKGVVGYHLECIQISKDTFKKPDSGSPS